MDLAKPKWIGAMGRNVAGKGGGNVTPLPILMGSEFFLHSRRNTENKRLHLFAAAPKTMQKFMRGGEHTLHRIVHLSLK